MTAPPALRADPLPLAALIKIPRQPRSVALVHSVLDAGMAVIRAEGLAAMTTNRVAERAGISIGSLYQYFANRESILAGIIERSQRDISYRIRELQMAQADIGLEDLFRLGLGFMLRYYEPHLPVVRLVLTDYPLLADSSAVRVVEATLLDMVRDYLLAHAGRYRLRHGTAGLYAAVNALIFLYLKWLVQPAPWVSEAQFIEALVAQAMTCVEVISA